MGYAPSRINIISNYIYDKAQKTKVLDKSYVMYI